MKILKDEIDTLIQSEKYSFVRKFDDDDTNRYANYFLFLYNNEQNIMAKYNAITLDDLLISEFYWYTALRRRHLDVYGDDGGLGDQHFRVLERIDTTAENEVDWNIIKAIYDEFNL